jgi:hypothetical protein
MPAVKSTSVSGGRIAAAAPAATLRGELREAPVRQASRSGLVPGSLAAHAIDRKADPGLLGREGKLTPPPKGKRRDHRLVGWRELRSSPSTAFRKSCHRPAPKDS